MSEIHVLARGLRFPEGPVAMRDGSVVLVEIERQTVTRVAPDGTVSVVAHTGGGPNGLAVGPDGAFYVCNNGGFAWRTEMNMLRRVQLWEKHHTLAGGGPRSPKALAWHR